MKLNKDPILAAIKVTNGDIMIGVFLLVAIEFFNYFLRRMREIEREEEGGLMRNCGGCQCGAYLDVSCDCRVAAVVDVELSVIEAGRNLLNRLIFFRIKFI
jgi:hypothetical protein